jgi:putative two-component system response regulator
MEPDRVRPSVDQTVPVVESSRPSRARMRQSRILIVDDEEANVRVLSKILLREGFTDVMSSTDPTMAVPLFLEYEPDLVVLDLRMPGLDGFGVLEQLAPVIPEDTYLPVLVLSGDVTAAAKQRALRMGAKDILAKPFDISEVVLRIRNLLETRRLHLLLEENNQLLEAKVIERTNELDEAQIEMLQRLAAAAEVRDDETGQHTQRVGLMSGLLAHSLGWADADSELIRRAAPLHDLGKIGIPDGILMKAGKLTDEEFEVIKTHTTIGARILAGGRSGLVQLAERIASSHHERWDGSGYPAGLVGNLIPLEARIVSIVDVFDALAHDRPYRKAWEVPAVLTRIREMSGSHFDPHIVDVFVGQKWDQFAGGTAVRTLSDNGVAA